MSDLNWNTTPQQLGLDPDRFRRCEKLVEQWCATGEIDAVQFAVGNQSSALLRQYKASPIDEPLPPPAQLCHGEQLCYGEEREPLEIFTVASLTKPLVAMAALLLVERGQLLLGDRVSDLLPEFGGRGRYNIRVRHLLTHTSGLPDLLPHDRDLRRANATLQSFFRECCQVELLWPPGRGVAYSSLGFLLLGEILERISGRSLSEFLQCEIFAPLGMQDTYLGLPAGTFAPAAPNISASGSEIANRLRPVQLPADQLDGESWNWNSRYWRCLGAPWGGLLSTANDLAAFAGLMLRAGRHSSRQIFSPAMVEAATRNQLEGMREVPEMERRCRPWGFGWRLNWPSHGAYFGDLLSSTAYGHWGATGTLLWIDPQRSLFAVILTSRPQDPDGPLIARLSNALAAAQKIA